MKTSINFLLLKIRKTLILDAFLTASICITKSENLTDQRLASKGKLFAGSF